MHRCAPALQRDVDDVSIISKSEPPPLKEVKSGNAIALTADALQSTTAI
jgi:hypothetical protein